MQDDDRFGVLESAFAAAQKAHMGVRTMRVGMYVPTRSEVRTMSSAMLRPLLVEWLWESPTELIPTDEQIRQVLVELEARPDAVELVGLIEECRAYIQG